MYHVLSTQKKTFVDEQNLNVFRFLTIDLETKLETHNAFKNNYTQYDQAFTGLNINVSS